MNREYSQYLKTHKWWRRRNKAMKLAGWWCQLCNKAKAVEVHHLTYERIFHELPSDLRAVCQDCHKRLHTLSLKESTEMFNRIDQNRRWGHT